MRVRHAIFSGVCVVAALWAQPSGAVDGVIEVNQAAVFAGGITPGDTPGFPVTLSQPGSYRLTGNLDVTKMQSGDSEPNAKNVTAIQATADDVTIDLNGFAIIGPVVCSGSPTSCAPSDGTAVGVDDVSARRVTVRNGTIRGMGGDGIGTTGTTSIEQVNVSENGGRGIAINEGIVRGCVAERNGGNGIQANDAVVANNVSRLNASYGIAAQGSTVIANNVQNNFSAGILGNGSVVLDNTVTSNTGVALEGANSTGYGNNVFNGNNSGGAQVSGGPLQIGTNVCEQDTVCP